MPPIIFPKFADIMITLGLPLLHQPEID